MSVFVVYKRNSGNQSDSMVSYSSSRETAEQLIPPDSKDFYIQELPKLELDKPKYTGGLWTRTDAAIAKEQEKYIKKSVVTDPMAHRTDYPMELPEAVVYYIKAFKDPSRQEKREIELFDSFDELSCKKINVNIAKNKQQGTPKTSREPNRHNVFKKRTIDRVVIPKLNNSVNTEQSKSSTFYKPKPKRPIIDVVDGKRVFRWSFSFSYPNLKPVVCKIFIENQRESSSVNFVAGPIFHDRDFKLIVYTTTQEKAEDMINKELKKLIAIGKIRAC